MKLFSGENLGKMLVEVQVASIPKFDRRSRLRWRTSDLDDRFNQC